MKQSCFQDFVEGGVRIEYNTHTHRQLTVLVEKYFLGTTITLITVISPNFVLLFFDWRVSVQDYIVCQNMNSLKTDDDVRVV